MAYINYHIKPGMTSAEIHAYFQQLVIEKVEQEKRMEAERKQQLELEQRTARLEEEQKRQAAILEKHEKRIADLEERMAIAEGEIDFQAQQLDRLRAHIEHAEMERDACVYGSSRYYQWDKKCLALEKQIHTAELKMAKARATREAAERELSA